MFLTELGRGLGVYIYIHFIPAKTRWAVQNLPGLRYEFCRFGEGLLGGVTLVKFFDKPTYLVCDMGSGVVLIWLIRHSLSLAGVRQNQIPTKIVGFRLFWVFIVITVFS